ncbi:hypothetical protein [Streptomyces sp. NPDC046942]|uniref:hypothetical protein n=1 Tax=Streptomyces sp. NPDC046942 TaxID=3155137 RepID=UPI00340D8E33
MNRRINTVVSAAAAAVITAGALFAGQAILGSTSGSSAPSGSRSAPYTAADEKDDIGTYCLDLVKFQNEAAAGTLTDDDAKTYQQDMQGAVDRLKAHGKVKALPVEYLTDNGAIGLAAWDTAQQWCQKQNY